MALCFCPLSPKRLFRLGERAGVRGQCRITQRDVKFHNGVPLIRFAVLWSESNLPCFGFLACLLLHCALPEWRPSPAAASTCVAVPRSLK